MTNLNRMWRAAAVGATLLVAAGALAAAPPVVNNGAKPAKGVRTAKLTELWRRGGESDDLFFGAAAVACPGPDGKVMILDSRLSEVKVFGPKGDLVATLGREGDGPGEVRRPGDMFVAADGTINMLQGFPGRIVRLHPDGTPAGEAKYSTGQPGAGQFAVMIRGFGSPAGMTLAGISMSFSGAGISTQEYFLANCGPDGVRKRVLLTKSNTIDYNDFILTEANMDFIWRRVAAGPDGRVYAAPERGEYRLRVFAPDGTPERDIVRAYTPPARTAGQKDMAKRILEGIAANYPSKPKRYEVEPTAPAVEGVWLGAGGRLWVLTGDEQPGRPAGTWIMLDVFAPDGTFEQQVALPGSYDQQQDALHLLPDGRLLVVVGALDAFLSQQAVAAGDQNAESDPLEVICYRLEP